MSFVQINNLEKKYPNQEFLSVQNFNLEIQRGEFIVFVGPSGCGKSTTLRMIAGLEEISGGELIIDGDIMNNVEPKNRNIAMVFQNYALYPHLSVYENIAFGLKIQKLPKEEIEEKVAWAADILGLTEYLDRKPKDLSGGQRQRVALGRAIVRNPKVFLMDEPLSNLDAKLRVGMRNEITKLHRELKATSIYVTHDQVEAMTMADRIVVLKDGIIQQVGTPIELYSNPINLFVASFIGTPQMNFINCEITDGNIILPDGTSCVLPEGINKKTSNFNGKVVLGIRPEYIKYDNLSINTLGNKVSLKVSAIEDMGHEVHVYSEYCGQKIITRMTNHINCQIGDTIEVAFDFNKASLFDFKNELSLMFDK